MKTTLKHLIIPTLLVLAFACGDDSFRGSGTLSVTVNTSTDIWGYPIVGTASYDGDTLNTWQYPAVGGDEYVNDTIDGVNDDGPGDRINVVYLYSFLGETSKTNPVLYRGESASNNSAVVIGGIVPGNYYVVAFYDYCGGGNLENILNRYDRYSVYVDSGDAEPGTANSSPFADLGVAVTIKDKETTEITLDIQKNWVLGKPNTGEGQTGRIFLQSSETIPTPSGT